MSGCGQTIQSTPVLYTAQDCTTLTVNEMAAFYNNPSSTVARFFDENHTEVAAVTKAPLLPK